MGTEVIDEVRQTVAEVLFVDLEELSAESSPETVSAWDSLGHLTLILALEQRFGITLDPGQLPHSITVQALADVVAAKNGKLPAGAEVSTSPVPSSSPSQTKGTIIRRASPGDLADIAKLLTARDEKPRDLNVVRDYLWGLDPQHTRAWLAVVDGQPVGMTMFYLREMNWPKAEQQGASSIRAGYWAHLYVEPEFRKHMIYPQLVAAMIDGMSEAGVSLIFTAMRRREIAEGHLKLGFADAGTLSVRLRPLRAFRLLAKHKGYAGLTSICKPLDAAYRLATRRRAPQDIAIETIGIDSPKVDQIAELLNDYPETTVRQTWKAEQFRRRFRTTLDGTDYRITAVSHGDQVEAALVLAIAERGNQIRAGVLLGLVARQDVAPAEVAALLADAEQFANQQDADLMLGLGSTLSAENLGGFDSKYLTSGSEIYHMMVYPPAMVQPPYSAAKISHWAFGFADHDAF